MLDLGRAYARGGATQAIAPLTEVVTLADDPAAIAAAAIELSGMLLFANRAAEGAVVLRQAQERLPPEDPTREQLQVALLGVSLTSVSTRSGAGIRMPEVRLPGRSARGMLPAATLAALATIELATDLVGSDFVVVVAVPMAVLTGLDRGATVDSLRRLLDATGVREGTSFIAHTLARYSSGVLRAAAGRHEAALEELRGCARDDPTHGGENPAFVPWRSSAALSLVELGRHDEARAVAAEEVRRAESFGAPRAIGIALRAQALVGPGADRTKTLEAALEVLAGSAARLEHARVLVDLGATLRAAGQRTAARDSLLEGLALAARCGARALEHRARAELGAIGVRPRTAEHAGADSLTPSERRVVELASAGGTNREIAQSLFVTEKTVETHLGRAFRKLDISSRRHFPTCSRTPLANPPPRSLQRVGAGLLLPCRRRTWTRCRRARLRKCRAPGEHWLRARMQKGRGRCARALPISIRLVVFK